MKFEIVSKSSNYIFLTFESFTWREAEILFDSWLDKYVNPRCYDNFILDTANEINHTAVV